MTEVAETVTAGREAARGEHVRTGKRVCPHLTVAILSLPFDILTAAEPGRATIDHISGTVFGASGSPILKQPSAIASADLCLVAHGIGCSPNLSTYPHASAWLEDSKHLFLPS
ncbi:hypothetical protein NL676_032495 [Syzygium grande]|nr:hypothetical protein NL676_032495 [Syzygium grande]